MAHFTPMTDLQVFKGRGYDQLTFTGPGGQFDYYVRPGSQKQDAGRWRVRIANIDTLELHFEFRENDLLRLRLISLEPEIQVIHISDYTVPERLRQQLILYLNPPNANIVKVKIPAGQQDQLTFVEIPNGTLMVDFLRERDRYHRYYTKETFDVLIRPNMRNPFTRAFIAPEDVRFYVAELDSSRQPYPAHGNFQNGGRRLRAKGKTRRLKHKIATS